MYKHEESDVNVTRITHGDGEEVIFECNPDYILDTVAADEHTDTIVIVLKRKPEEDDNV